MWGTGDRIQVVGRDVADQSDHFQHSISLGFGLHGGLSHNCISIEDRLEHCRNKGSQLGDDEVRFHLASLMMSPENVARSHDSNIPGFALLEPLLLETWDTVGKGMCESWCGQHTQVVADGHHIVTVAFSQKHWLPLWIDPQRSQLMVHTLQDEVIDDTTLMPLLRCLQQSLGFDETIIHRFPTSLTEHDLCGAFAIAFLAQVMTRTPMPDSIRALHDLHANLRANFVEAISNNTCCRCPAVWGSGSNGALIQALSSELSQHGVPPGLVEQKSQQAIRAIGSEQIQTALKDKNPWRALKVLGNNARFQFILPAELANLVADNKGTTVSRKKEATRIKTAPPPVMALDPTKLVVMDGTFRSNGQQLTQIGSKQIGPVASGIALLTLAEAEPYLRAGKAVSTEPLAIGVFPVGGQVIQTVLPHKTVTIPCTCAVNQEPLLAEAVVVQIGSGFVDKHVANPAITLDPLDVVTIKIIVYRDEFQGEWSDFVQSPIKHLVQIFPALKRCHEENCACHGWHNPEGLQLKEPIMDVSRRQFLKAGFRPTKASDAVMFSVCIRVPSSFMAILLTSSGQSGAYTEPRTPDGREVLAEYVVVWAAKLSLSELTHVKQTNPAAVGLARLGERRGLRTTANQAAALHAILRPEATYLPQGPKMQFVAGPFPWGSDRQAIARALKQSGWEVKALQPMQPIPSKGSMWLLQTIEEPPASILTTTHGEVVISKHKAQGNPSKNNKVHTVGAPSTISLCGTDAGPKPNEDPWLAHDPWKQYRPGRHHASAISSLLTEFNLKFCRSCQQWHLWSRMMSQIGFRPLRLRCSN